MNQVIKKRKSTDLNVRQIPGSEVHFFIFCVPLPDLYGSA